MTKVYGRKTVHNVIPPGFVMGHRQEHPAGGFLHAGRGNVTSFGSADGRATALYAASPWFESRHPDCGVFCGFFTI